MYSLAQTQKIKKIQKIHPEKISYIFPKQNFLYFGKWNFLTLRLKNFLLFSEVFILFRDMELSSPKFKKFQEGIFQAQEKNPNK